MTTLGKILTVLVLLFSLALGALLIFLYISRVNYANAYKKWRAEAELAQADAKGWKEKAEQSDKRDSTITGDLKKASGNVKDADPSTVAADKVRTEAETREKKILSLEAQVDGLNKSLLVEKKKNDEYDAIVKAHQLESEQNLKDKVEVKEQLKKANEANTILQVAANKAREEKVKAEIQAGALLETNKDLVTRGQELAIELTKTKKALLTGNTGTAGVTTLTTNTRNPPPFAVDGKVLAVSDDLVEISIGSDAGLVVGHTLDAFRLSPKPLSLGMIRLIRVEPTRSVGQVVGKSTSPLQRGDDVASKLVRN